jgi:hypothetical protein
MANSKNEISKDKADLYDVVMPLLRAMYKEFTELSKKNPRDALSKNKIKIVNRVLESCSKILDAEPSKQYLDLLEDEDATLQNSDVIIILSQYVAAMEQFKLKYYDDSTIDPFASSDGRWLTK